LLSASNFGVVEAFGEIKSIPKFVKIGHVVRKLTWGSNRTVISQACCLFRVKLRNVLVCRDGGGDSVIVLGSMEREAAL
jgi:hypothetical protein